MAWEIVGVILIFVAVLLCARPLGTYMAKVFSGERVFLSRVFQPVERRVYRVIGVREDGEQSWVGYLMAVLVVTLVSIVLTFLLLRFQDRLPLQSVINPQGLPGVAPDLAMNTSISFATNTNWQNYAGETTMTYFSQMVALVMHNFLSAATGLAIAIALIRGLARRSGKTLGNFYVDATRGILYVLLPLAVIGTLIFVSQGAIQNFSPYTSAHTLSGVTQTIAQGPVASQEMIKDLGNNGGGFFNANSAHPYENPNGFTNAFTIFALLLIAVSLTFTFGKMVGSIKQGLAVLAAMGVILVGMTGIAIAAEQTGNPALVGAGVTQTASSTQSGGNMEGKEVRFGIPQSGQFVASTTGTSTGAVDASHDSLTPIGGLVPLLSIELGEITPGGIGAGPLRHADVRHPRRLHRRTDGRSHPRVPRQEDRIDGTSSWRRSPSSSSPLSILGLTAVSVLVPAGQLGPLNSGPHGFSEILYAFSSTTGNNGSAFAGLTGNTLYYNSTLDIAMWMGRYLFLIPILALAGSMVKKKVIPASAGTFPTDTPLFTGLLLGVVLIVGALTFFPALALGPLLEHFQLAAGHLH